MAVIGHEPDQVLSLRNERLPCLSGLVWDIVGRMTRSTVCPDDQADRLFDRGFVPALARSVHLDCQ